MLRRVSSVICVCAGSQRLRRSSSSMHIVTAAWTPARAHVVGDRACAPEFAVAQHLVGQDGGQARVPLRPTSRPVGGRRESPGLRRSARLRGFATYETNACLALHVFGKTQLQAWGRSAVIHRVCCRTHVVGELLRDMSGTRSPNTAILSTPSSPAIRNTPRKSCAATSAMASSD